MKIFFVMTLLCCTAMITASAQSKEYTVRKYEYKTDSQGKSVQISDMEYYRISAKDNSSWGFINKNGDVVIPLGKYKFLQPIDEQGMILAHKGGKEGYIDITEKILIPFIYDDIGVFSECIDLAPVISGGKQGFVNRKGEIVIPLEYKALSYVTYFYDPGVAILIKNGKYGVIGPRNNIIIPFEFDKIERSDNKDCFIVTKNNNWSNYSFEGKQLSAFDNYQIVTQTPLGYLPENSKDLPILVKKEGDKKLRNEIRSSIDYYNATKRIKDSLNVLVGEKFAYINKEHNILVPFGEYDVAEPFGLGRKAVVANKGKYGIIDESGELALPLEYDFIERPSLNSGYSNVFVATKDNNVTILNKNLEKCPIEGIVSYRNHNANLIVTDNHGKQGAVDYKGNLTIPIMYDTLYGGIARIGDKYGYISGRNEIIKPFEYKYIEDVKGGLVLIDQNDKAGLCDNKGRLKIPFEYEAIYDTYYNNVSKSYYIVQKDGKIGTVDEDNNVIIPIIYDGLSGWVEYGPDAHFVKKDGKYGLITHYGKIMIPIEYDYVGLPEGGLARVLKNGLFGVVDMKGHTIMPFEYEALDIDIPMFTLGDEKHNDKIVTYKNGTYKYFDLKGKIINMAVSPQIIRKENEWLYKFCNTPIKERAMPSNEDYYFHMKLVAE